MTPEEIYLVRSSWEKVFPISEQAAQMFYGRLFDRAPELRSLFKSDMHEQGRRLMQMIDAAVNGLEQFDQLVPRLRDLGKRHAGYGVQETDYDVVGSALLWTLEQGLGQAFTDEVKRAWIDAYTALAGAMKRGAAEVVAA